MIKLKSLNLLLKKTGSFHSKDPVFPLKKTGSFHSKNLVFHIVNLEVFSFILKVFFQLHRDIKKIPRERDLSISRGK